MIDGAEAWQRSLAEPHAVWDGHPESPGFRASVRGRIEAGAATPFVKPKFTLRPDDVFFCIGSCFARVIEFQLLYRQAVVTSLSIVTEPDEAPWDTNGVMGKFTTASMLNELHWSLGGEPFPDEALVADGDGYRDLQLQRQPFAVSLERARARRRVVKPYFERLRDATVVIVTLGLAEVWYDRLTGLYLNIAPTFEMVQANPGRFAVTVSDYQENRERFDRICDILTESGPPGLRIVVTVSPVPLHRTFAAEDALTVNTYAKSTLRAVAGDVARARANVEYFPAYEIVTHTERRTAYQADQLHVAPAVEELIGATFFETFGLDMPRQHPEYEERGYLRANPDVKTAVVRGQFGSGYEHWLRHGRDERRPLN
jgi:GSCFA family